MTARAFIQAAPEGIEMTGKPGETLSCLLPTEQGWNDIHVNCSLGENTSKDEIRHIFTGMDVPGAVGNFKVSTGEDPHLIVFEWTPPTTGQNGYYVDPEGKDTKYYLTVGQETPFGTYWQVYDYLGTGVQTATLAVDEGVPNGFYKMGIVAETVAGKGEGFPFGVVQAGDPNKLPVIEDFWGGQTHYYSYNISDDAYLPFGYATSMSLIRPSTIGVTNDSDLAIMVESSQNANARLDLPRFSTADVSEADIKISVCTDSTSPETVNICADAYGVDPIVLATTGSDKSGWQEITCKLPEALLGKAWVDVYLEMQFTDGGQSVLVDKFSFKKPVEHELGFVAVLGQQSVIMGQDVVWNVITRNMGSSSVKAPQIKYTIAKGDKVLEESTATLLSSATVDSDELSLYKIEFKTSSNSTGELAIKAEMDCDDADKSNNSINWQLDVNTGNKVFVDDLTGSRDDAGGVRLEWTEPFVASNGSFEYGDAFALAQNIGPFVNVDKDGEVRTKFSLWGFPGMGDPAGFQVWDLNDIQSYLQSAGLQSDYSTYDGVRTLTAMCPYDAVPADDWLISPELKAGSEFSFAMAPMSTYYGEEVVEVLTSDGSVNTDDFKLLANASITPEYAAPREWKVYSYTLPQGATRFAIRYRGQAIGILVDGIKMSAVEGDTRVSGYTVRRNGTVIDEEAPATTSFHDADNVPDGTVYTVQPIITEPDGTIWKGEESNTAMVGFAGIADVYDNIGIYSLPGAICIKGAPGKHARVFGTDGTARFTGVLSENSRISLEPGLYIVRIDGVAVKVIVK